MVLNEDDRMFILNPSRDSESDKYKMDNELISKIEELTKIRKSISLDLKHIASATKISTNHLKNIENLKFDKLPPFPMRHSFIDQYCHIIEKAKKKF